MSEEEAEIIGLQALAWLASDEGLLSVFLGASGATAQDVQTRAADLEFLGAVLDFICMDDDWIAAFAAEAGLPPDQPLAARQALPGGGLPHYT